MIVLDKLEYVGPCHCGRKQRVIMKKGAYVRSAIKVMCDGKLFRSTPMTINGQAYPQGAKITTWCRSKHYRWEDLAADDE